MTGRQIAAWTRKSLLAVVYIAAFAVAAFLIYDMLQLASERPSVMVVFGTAPTPTSEPTPEPTVSQAEATMLLDQAAPGPVAPVITDSSADGMPNVAYHPKTGRYIAAWFPPSFSGGARESFEANKDILDEISPFWYSTDATGRLYGTWDEELVRSAHEANVLVLPSVHNIGSENVVISVLNDPYVRARHVQNIVDEVLARGYDGIDIDYESLPENMRPSFSAFIIELSEALHAHDKLLSIAVHPKDCDYCGLGGFQDWNVIGQHADRVRIMTYDYSWRGSAPGPIAPLYWVESVAEYARSVIDPAKVSIGIPFYGYDWPPNGTARGLPWSDIEELIEAESVEVNIMQRDEQQRPVDESWFRYPSAEGTREVWYMTDDSLESKIDLVQRMDLGGIAIWRIGYERPEYWETIRRTLVQDPVVIQRSINPLLPEH